MKNKIVYNIVVLLPAVLIRIPLLITLGIISWIGQWAGIAYECVNEFVPGFKR